MPAPHRDLNSAARESETPSPRLAWADSVKGLLITLVVLGHVVVKTYLEIDWQISWPIPGIWGSFVDFTYPIRMPLFFVISGCFAVNALRRPWKSVLRTRVIRYYYLYLIWTLIHAVVIWSFPDFPTFVPRSLTEFVDAVTITPTSAWYLYALALYFVVAKTLVRLPAWIPLTAATALYFAVQAEWIQDASNRGSLVENLIFYMLGVYLAPRILNVANQPRLRLAMLLGLGYVILFGLGVSSVDVSSLGASSVGGLGGLDGLGGISGAIMLNAATSVVGVLWGLALAPMIPRIKYLGRGLGWLGVRTLPIYVIHMPILVLMDVFLVGWISDARIAVQLVAAFIVPLILTATVIGVCVGIGSLITREGPSWLLDLPGRSAPKNGKPRGMRLPWKVPTVTLTIAALTVAGTSYNSIPAQDENMAFVRGAQLDRVTIGATGDVLLHDADTRVPPDQGERYFDQVRDWFQDDLVMGNLEQTITDNTTTNTCQGLQSCLTFRSAPETAPYFAGFNMMNLANNHSRDFGAQGFEDTRRYLQEQGIRAVGERDEISYTAVNDIVVAVVGFTTYSGFNRVTNLRQVRNLVRTAAQNSDVVVVQAHMGSEGEGADVVRPGTETAYGENRGDPMEFSRVAIDEGADVVIGHGPHFLRGIQWYKGKMIAYSLGNFGGGGVFGEAESTRYGAYLSLTLDKQGVITDGSVRSVTFDYETGIPQPDPNNTAAQLINSRGARDFGDQAATFTSDH